MKPGWFSRFFSSNVFGETITPFKNPLAGKRMRYLIGADEKTVLSRLSYDVITVLPFDWEGVLPPWPVGYCNLYWQEGAPDCAPYLESTDTAKEYGERVIDPTGQGFSKNLRWQFEKWKNLGVIYIELDNTDGYLLADLFTALELAERYGLKVIAKNPGLLDGAAKYVAQCHGIISEDGAGDVALLHGIRWEAGFPTMPIWFVAHGAEGEKWCRRLQIMAGHYKNMGVTLSRGGEYTEAEDVVVPHQ